MFRIKKKIKITIFLNVSHMVGFGVFSVYSRLWKIVAPKKSIYCTLKDYFNIYYVLAAAWVVLNGNGTALGIRSTPRNSGCFAE